VYPGADPLAFTASLREGTLDPGTPTQPSQDEIVWTWSDPDGGLGGYLDRNWIKLVLNAPGITDLAGNELSFGYLQSVKVMPGDVDGNTVVISPDRLAQLSSLGKINGMPGYNPRADVNADGFVISSDRLSLLGYLGQFLPPEPSEPGPDVLLSAAPVAQENRREVLRSISVELQRNVSRGWNLESVRLAGATGPQAPLGATWRSALDRYVGTITDRAQQPGLDEVPIGPEIE